MMDFASARGPEMTGPLAVGRWRQRQRERRSLRTADADLAKSGNFPSTASSLVGGFHEPTRPLPLMAETHVSSQRERLLSHTFIIVTSGRSHQ